MKIQGKMSAWMYDTVGLKHYWRKLPNEDFKNRWKKLQKNFPTWIYNHKGKGTLPNLTIFQTPDGFYHSELRVSLPNMLFGHNAKLPTQTEADEGLRFACQYAEEISGLPFSLDTAIIFLVHYAYDAKMLESAVWRMIAELSKKKFPPLRKQFFDDETIYFTSKAKVRAMQLRIYSKLNEMLSKGKATPEALSYAEGTLRFELALLEMSAITALAKRLDFPERTAKYLLTEGVSRFVLNEVLEKLNYYELLDNSETELDILRKHFPTKKAILLSGFRQMQEEHGDQFYKDARHGISKDVFYAMQRDCRKAKVR